MQEYEILMECIPLENIDKVLRKIHLDLLDKGISKRELDWWSFNSRWFGPDLWYSEEVTALKEFLPERLKTSVETGPQIILTFPEEGTKSFEPHIDETPNVGEQYKNIVGVALTSWTKENGSVELHTKEGIVIPELDAGDVLIMNPNLPHTRGRNRSGQIRYSIYFRWLLTN